MASGCISIVLITVLSMFSLVVSKPFLGDLLARAIASSSTPNDPQSHISDFRMTSKMDMKVEKLKLVDAKENHTSIVLNHTTSEEPPMEFITESSTTTAPTVTLWQRWNRTEFLARIIDDILKPAQERITLVFQTLVARDGARDSREKMIENNSARTGSEHLSNSSGENGSDDLGSDLELGAEHETEPDLIDQPALNGSTLLGQIQARRNVLRRRVAKALSSITGLLILAANTRREAKTRSVRSIETPVDTDGWSAAEGYHLLDVSNVVGPHDERLPDNDLESEHNLERPRRNVESIGIFILEVFGSIAGFSWGIFKQVQSFLL